MQSPEFWSCQDKKTIVWTDDDECGDTQAALPSLSFVTIVGDGMNCLVQTGDRVVGVLVTGVSPITMHPQSVELTPRVVSADSPTYASPASSEIPILAACEAPVRYSAAQTTKHNVTMTLSRADGFTLG